MYYILYTNKANVNTWELVENGDAMLRRVDELIKTQHLEYENILVIDQATVLANQT